MNRRFIVLESVIAYGGYDVHNAECGNCFFVYGY